MKFLKSCKADLSLSINAIVILILAIVLLGLGLSFIKGMLGGTFGKLEKIADQIDEQQKQELLSSAKAITFSSTTIRMKERIVQPVFAIRNTKDTPQTYTFDGQSSGFSCSASLSKEQDALLTVDNFKMRRDITLPSGEATIMVAEITLPAQTKQDIFFCEFKLDDQKVDLQIEYKK